MLAYIHTSSFIRSALNYKSPKSVREFINQTHREYKQKGRERTKKDNAYEEMNTNTLVINNK